MKSGVILPTVAEQSDRSVKGQTDVRCQRLKYVVNEAATINKALSKNFTDDPSKEFPPKKPTHCETLPLSLSGPFHNLQPKVDVLVPPVQQPNLEKFVKFPAFSILLGKNVELPLMLVEGGASSEI